MEAFNSEKYLEHQYAKILEKINLFSGKLYMEFGGKIFDDLHASRVLPGFAPDIKIQLLKKLQADSEIIIAISADAIEKNKIRADFNITYGDEVLRLIDNLRAEGLTVSAVVITLFNGQKMAKMFGDKLVQRKENVYYHKFTKGYPTEVDTIVSDEGYGENPFIKTTKKLVIVTAPGPNSGKLATCLSQLYHEYKAGNKAGYAKYETFPVWNLSLSHPVNIAYEAATADLKDVNLIDTFHFDAYGVTATNYNRDLMAFPLIKNILSKIMGSSNPYNSPTDMGVNMIKSGIVDDVFVQNSAKQEVIRRYFHALCDFKKGLAESFVIDRIEQLMLKMNIKASDRVVADYANNKSKECGLHVVSVQLKTGEIISGKTKNIISATTACILNVIKHFAGIEDSYDLIPKSILNPILFLNKKILGKKSELLSLKDILIALSVSATTNNKAQKALNELGKLRGLEAHSTFMLSPNDDEIVKKLGILCTSEPVFANNNLFED